MSKVLKELHAVLDANNKSIDQIKFATISSDVNAPVEMLPKEELLEYLKVDDETNNINANLVIVGDDWWLEINCYTGGDLFIYKSLPACPVNKTTLTSIFW